MCRNLVGRLPDRGQRSDDHRCFKWGTKLRQMIKQKCGLYLQIHDRLLTDGLLAVGASVSKVKESVANTELRDLIEYSRAVHAEMEAIISGGEGRKGWLSRIDNVLNDVSMPFLRPPYRSDWD